MSEKEQLYQAVTLVAVVLLFEFLERLRPGHVVDKQHDLTLNIMALLIVIFAGEMWKKLILNWLTALAPDKFFSLDTLRTLPGAVKILLGLILGGLCLYWVHRAMHRPALWRTHTFHHSIEELWWLSGSRTSLTHLFLFAVPQIFIAYLLFKMSPLEAGIAFSCGVIVNVWIHTNIWVTLGSLEWILITPNYHRIHHGARGLSNNNLGFIFTVWDRMFGTYVNPQSTGKDFTLGFVSTRDRLFRMINLGPRVGAEELVYIRYLGKRSCAFKSGFPGSKPAALNFYLNLCRPPVVAGKWNLFQMLIHKKPTTHEG